MPDEKVRVKDKSSGTQVSNFSDKIPLTRPKSVRDDQWKKAVEVYNVAKKNGDKFPELTVAQAALETGWFDYVPASYNYFGQKATKSQSGVVAGTSEVAKGGKGYKTNSKFRQYSSLDESIQDRMRKWGSKYENATTIGDALYSIWQYDPSTKTGKGYATSPSYDKAIKNVLKGMGLNFDLQSGITETPFETPKTPETQFEVDATIPFKLESGEVTSMPISSELFEKEVEKEKLKDEMIQESPARQKIEQEQEKRRSFLENMGTFLNPSQESSQPQETEESFVPPVENIDVQSELPQLPNLFNIG